jgi:hypothetical protein
VTFDRRVSADSYEAWPRSARRRRRTQQVVSDRVGRLRRLYTPVGSESL